MRGDYEMPSVEAALRAPDPVMFLRYWNKPDETAAKFTPDGEWL
jgi:acetyl-CoA synthetase